MTRRYGFDQMTVDDHDALFAAGAVPTEGDSERRVAHGHDLATPTTPGGVAYLQFSNKPDGRLEAATS